jgi:hypothetical protein
MTSLLEFVKNENYNKSKAFPILTRSSCIKTVKSAGQLVRARPIAHKPVVQRLHVVGNTPRSDHGREQDENERICHGKDWICRKTYTSTFGAKSDEIERTRKKTVGLTHLFTTVSLMLTVDGPLGVITAHGAVPYRCSQW